ncbi:MAG: hypothetical protein V1645_01360 [archaeon]
MGTKMVFICPKCGTPYQVDSIADRVECEACSIILTSDNADVEID